ATGHVEAVLVGHGDDAVGDLRVICARPEVLADPLDQVGPPGASGVDRPDRIGPDHAHPAVAHVLQVTPGARDGAAGADARHEVGDAALCLLPDLRAGALDVRRRVVRVRVLVRLPCERQLAHQPVGHRVVGVGVFGVDRGRADHDVGAVGAEHVDLV